MATNSLYVTTKTLEPYFVDKTTGLALANGTVEFFKDSDRTVPKGIFELAGSPPNYTFEALPNPVTLSGQGTIMDAAGNNVALYYLPFDTDQPGATEELYYVVVKDSAGTAQFTREGWPGSDGDPSATTVADGTVVNQIVNGQFSDVFFDASVDLDIAYTGSATTTTRIAPSWDLEIIHTGAGSVKVTRTAIAGSTNVKTNPPYTLSITPSDNMISMRLYQQLTNISDIWVPKVAGTAGFVAGGVLLGDASTVAMNYNPSNGTTQAIFTDTNATGVTNYFGATVQLNPGDNNTVAGSANVQIELILSLVNPTVLSSIQLVGLESNQTSVAYRQDTIDGQRASYSNIISVVGGVQASNTGRLTLTTAVPVTTADVTAAGTLYYTPYNGNTTWLFINNVWTLFEYSEVSVAIPAATTQMYDVFVDVSIATATIELSLLAWTNDTTRATALTTQDGIYVLTGDTSKKYLGSVRSTGVASETEDSVVKRFLYNHYNRVSKQLLRYETTSTWTYTTATWRQANAATANQVEVVQGMIENTIKVDLGTTVQNDVAGGGTSTWSGIGVDSITVPTHFHEASSASPLHRAIVSVSTDIYPPAIGYHYYAWMEFSAAAGTTTWRGTGGVGSTNGLIGSCMV